MSTQENNKMIAEFMGYENIGTDNNPMYTFYDNYFEDGNRTLEELCYHKDWNWLMPVVEKIKNIAVKDENIEVFYEVANHIPDRHETYKAVVEFINQLNK